MGGLWTAFAAVLVLALGGCATARREKVEAAPPPAEVIVSPPIVVEVQSPAAQAPPRACVPRTLPPPPRYPDTDQALRAAPGAADRYQLMAAGRLLRQRRLEELERIIAACR